MQKDIFENNDRKKLTDKLSNQYKNKVANFISRMSNEPLLVDDTKHKLEFSIPNRHPSNFRPSFCQKWNIKTGAGNNNDLKVSLRISIV